MLCYALCGKLLCKSERDRSLDSPLVLCYALCGKLLCKSEIDLSFDYPLVLYYALCGKLLCKSKEIFPLTLHLCCCVMLYVLCFNAAE